MQLQLRGEAVRLKAVIHFDVHKSPRLNPKPKAQDALCLGCKVASGKQGVELTTPADVETSEEGGVGFKQGLSRVQGLGFHRL